MLNSIIIKISENSNLYTVSTIPTGIADITAYKIGRIVQLKIFTESLTASTVGWQEMGTLPESLRPINEYNGLLLDTYAGSYSDLPRQFRITGGGDVRWYAFVAESGVYLRGLLTYISAN